MICLLHLRYSVLKNKLLWTVPCALINKYLLDLTMYKLIRLVPVSSMVTR